MLIISLFVSGAILGFAIILASRLRSKPQVLIGVLISVSVLSMGCMYAAAFAPMIQSFGLVAIAIVWQLREGGTCSFVAASVLVSLGSYVITWWFWVRPEMNKFAELRAKYPMESMVARVPAPPPGVQAPLSEAAQERLRRQEWKDESQDYHRIESLERLHDHAVLLFVNSPGFGAVRMMRPTEWNLQKMSDQPEPIPQPGPHDASSGNSEGAAPSPSAVTDSSLAKLHLSSIFDFLDPERFGLIKNREQVAGFIPHRMSMHIPDPPSWTVQTLDLVGLLMHDQPVAYVSEHLPRMDELKEAPTRPLDAFEKAGLDGIRQGEDLFSRESGNMLRLIGAIRATKQCVVCHGCERGDLLGAFSYTLKRVEGNH